MQSIVALHQQYIAQWDKSIHSFACHCFRLFLGATENCPALYEWT